MEGLKPGRVAVYCRVAREEQKKTSRNKKPLEWMVYYHDSNRKEIRAINVLEHWRFRKNVAEYAKKITNKEEFAQKLRSELMYNFWGKFEYEIIISPWGSFQDTREIKVDIYDQVMINWDRFLDYVWENRHLLKGEE